MWSKMHGTLCGERGSVGSNPSALRSATPRAIRLVPPGEVTEERNTIDGTYV